MNGDIAPALWQEVAAAANAIRRGRPGSHLDHPQYDIARTDDEVVIRIPDDLEVIDQQPAPDPRGGGRNALAQAAVPQARP